VARAGLVHLESIKMLPKLSWQETHHSLDTQEVLSSTQDMYSVTQEVRDREAGGTPVEHLPST
jgi:hypothetical protein